MSQAESWPKQEQKRKNKKRTITNPNQSTGHWSELEHKTYVDFLNMHRSVMESQDQKKTSKIFKLMSETIGTRSPSQCRQSIGQNRSHHQKFNPFIHQVKKRQKGAGRKKQFSSPPQDKQENLIQQFMFQYYPQFPTQEYQFMQLPFMFPNKEELDPQFQFFPFMDEKNVYFMPSQQMQFPFMYPQGELLKDNQEQQ